MFKDVDVIESILVGWAARLSVQKSISCGIETVLFLFVLSRKKPRFKGESVLMVN
jgi:hypothetical protein